MLAIRKGKTFAVRMENFSAFCNNEWTTIWQNICGQNFPLKKFLVCSSEKHITFVNTNYNKNVSILIFNFPHVYSLDVVYFFTSNTTRFQSNSCQIAIDFFTEKPKRFTAVMCCVNGCIAVARVCFKVEVSLSLTVDQPYENYQMWTVIIS